MARSVALLLTALGDLPTTVLTSGSTVLPMEYSGALAGAVANLRRHGLNVDASSGPLPGPSCASRSQSAFARSR